MKKGMALAALVVAASSLIGQVVAFRWVDNWAFQGEGLRQTEPIRVWGGEWRVDYQGKGRMPFAVKLMNLDDGKAIQVASRRGNDVAFSGRASGDGPISLAYFRVEAGHGTSWSLKTSQYLDKPDEWKWLRWQPYAKKLLPFGSWSGEPGNRTFSLEFTDVMGRLTLTQNQPGRVEIEVVDESGQIVMDCVSLGAGSVDSWFYKPGVYTVTLSAIDASWSLMAETVAAKP